MSENIFTEIYNKILGLFGQNVQKDDSKDTAVNRLRLVLMQDRTNLTPEILHRMRSELIEVLSKYVELDKEALELNFEQEGEQMALMLSIPVVRAKDEAEIEEILKKEDEAKKAAQEAEEDDEDSDEVSEDDDASDNDETEETSDEDENAEEAKESPSETSESEQKEEQFSDGEQPTEEPTKTQNSDVPKIKSLKKPVSDTPKE
jgi:cell division topological specificity factor